MPTFPPELLDRLPKEGRAKILTLDHARAAAHAAVRAAQAQQIEAWEVYDRAKLTADTAIANFPRASITAEDKARLNAPIEPARAAAEQADFAVSAASSRFRTFAFLDDAEDWLKRAVALRAKLTHHPLPAVKAGDHLAAVKKIRAELKSCDEAWAAAAAAPAPAPSIRAAILKEIEAAAAAGAPHLEFRARGAAPVDVRGLLSVGDPAPFLAWLLKDVLADRLTDLLDGADLADAMTDRQRDKALDEIGRKRLALEFEEEAHIAAAAAVGHVIQRRRDLDPRVLFEVTEVGDARP